MFLRTSVLALALTLSACSSSGGGCGQAEKPAESAAAPAPEKPAEPAPAEAKAPSEALMRDHFVKAYEAREALIRADLEGTKTAMKFLAEHQRAEALPEALRPMLADMQRAAATTATASSLREAGEALAGTFARCGVCHKATGKGPTIATTPMPEGTDAVMHMKRHHWATQVMWEALVTADDERFAQAVTALKEGTLDPKGLGVTNVPEEDLLRLDAHIHKLANEAASASDLRGRAQAYARILATCATCHKLTGRGPQPTGEVEPVPSAM